MRTKLALLALLAFATACQKKTDKPDPAHAHGATAAGTPAATQPAEPRGPVVAVAELVPLGGSGVTGTVKFTHDVGIVKIEANVTGLTPGQHGFHVHEFGDCSDPEGKSAGNHFNPQHVDHSGPDAATAHVGDMGNLLADENGQARLSLQSRSMTLGSGPHDIVGRSVIVHAAPDDLTTQPGGNAGGRVACGTIHLEGMPAKPVMPPAP